MHPHKNTIGGCTHLLGLGRYLSALTDPKPLDVLAEGRSTAQVAVIAVSPEESDRRGQHPANWRAGVKEVAASHHQQDDAHGKRKKDNIMKVHFRLRQSWHLHTPAPPGASSSTTPVW